MNVMPNKVTTVSAFLCGILMLACINARAGESALPPVILSSDPQGLRISLHADLNLDYLGFDEGEEYIDGAGSQENDFIARRARVGFDGRYGDNVSFRLKWTLESPENPLLDGYADFELPWSIHFRAGQMKMPFSQERLRSDSHNAFMEKSLSGNNLSINRSQGLYVYNSQGAFPLQVYAGIFTGEARNQHNTDDDFEYAGRIVLTASDLFDSFPGEAIIRGSAATGRRRPVRRDPFSFSGKTMNQLTFFPQVPVKGWRTRYEADFEWRYRSLWTAFEYIHCSEQRNDVTVDLDTDFDAIADDSVTRDLDPLIERGWMVYVVWIVTGEEASGWINPSRPWGALGLAMRYSVVSFDSQEDLIPASAPGTYGRETSEASEAFGRSGIDETVSDFYLGLNWYIKPGVFFQSAVIWQWFENSSPYLTDDRSDINYRARIGIIF